MDETDLMAIEETILRVYNNNNIGSKSISEPDNQDTSTLLSQSRQDAQLAAKAGNLLLSQNKDLSTKAIKLEQNLEVLQQENLGLRRRVDLIEAENESRIAELQADLNYLRNQLSNQESNMRLIQHEKDKLISELAEQKEQNQNVTTKLREVFTYNEQLTCNLREAIREQEKLSDCWHDEKDKRVELERKLVILTSEKDGLVVCLEELNLKVSALEQQIINDQLLIVEKQREIDDVRKENVELRVSSIENGTHYLQQSFTGHCQQTEFTSLLSEIKLTSQRNPDSDKDLNSPLCGSECLQSGFPLSIVTFPSNLEDQEDLIEVDEDFYTQGHSVRESTIIDAHKDHNRLTRDMANSEEELKSKNCWIQSTVNNTTVQKSKSFFINKRMCTIASDYEETIQPVAVRDNSPEVNLKSEELLLSSAKKIAFILAVPMMLLLMILFVILPMILTGIANLSKPNNMDLITVFPFALFKSNDDMVPF